MAVEKSLRAYNEIVSPVAREEMVQETIQKVKEVVAVGERDGYIRHWEFLMGQFRLTRKRWWLLQLLVLGLAALVLPCMPDKTYMVRALGLIGVLFVILIIPEFWKNESCDCLQVEATCLYSLRQIYAARMLMFGIIDVMILSGFCLVLKGAFNLALTEITVQFLFPATVTACICFASLSSRIRIKEGTAIFFSLLWSTVWCVVLVNETVYQAITQPLWFALLGLAFVFLLGAGYKTLCGCKEYWEVDIHGITTA